MKKYISILLIILMGIFMIPTAVFAEDTDPSFVVEVGGEYYDLLEGNVPEHVTFDSETNTITLDGFEGGLVGAYGLDFTLVLKGENTIAHDDEEEGACLANEGGNITIEGDGILNLQTNGNYTYGIAVVGDLTIKGGTINYVGSKDNGTLGLYIVGGNLVVESGAFNIEDCDMGIYFDESSGARGGFTGNGGKMTIKKTSRGIYNAYFYSLNGLELEIDDAYMGVFATEFHGPFEMNSGKLIIKNIDNYGMALGMLYGGEDPSGAIMINKDKLYIDSDVDDFRVAVAGGKPVLIFGPESLEGKDVSEDITDAAKELYILPKDIKTYEVTEGDGQKINGSAKDIKIDADLDKFVALYINDELVDDENYDLEEGSTIIKLKDEYIKNLDAGTYIFRAVFTDGGATGTFEIASSDPETGDSIMYFVLLLIGGLMSFGFLKSTCEKN